MGVIFASLVHRLIEQIRQNYSFASAEQYRDEEARDLPPNSETMDRCQDDAKVTEIERNKDD
eukprot:CAMPEP_0202447812 /NCGR_PEP_ID=MMETSP1360-20130828/6573_1 /ASSEMBLY_ACC=CAM_ASM_000848 /TAXON_ID=515479 /ORGANISM="Licmophora paradoxa, Strain CCMP2313" /LENGTH=61 /DNA_ID=CAMNT_0049065059 /DNA_START=219 /DNA_END=404 /DNA_ORIENTATION=+